VPGLAAFSIADSAPAFHEVTQLVPHECVVRMNLGFHRLARSTKGGKFCPFPLRIGRSSFCFCTASSCALPAQPQQTGVPALTALRLDHVGGLSPESA
jgi:hypothetical protein